MAGNSPTTPGGALEAYFRASVSTLSARPPTQHPLTRPELELIFDAQAGSRQLDVVARELQALGEGYYTIGSAGHESNAAIAYALRPDDPALLHYRSGGFYLLRSGRSGVQDVLQGLMAHADEPIAGGRHKVFGNKALHIIPQTSTIASHLPRAVGLAVALPRTHRIAPRGTRPEWPADAVVVASFGDASANHSTATGAINTAINTAYRGLPVPILFVCEDNGYGISVPTPKGWIETAYGARPGLSYFSCDGTDPDQVYATARQAVAVARTKRRPVFLHLHCVRFLAHAGSDAEITYRSRRQIEADYARDPLLGTAQALVDLGVTPEEVLGRYDARRSEIDDQLQALVGRPRLASAEAVMAPLAPRHPERVATHAEGSLIPQYSRRVEDPARPCTLAEAINKTLDDVLTAEPRAIVFGEDVGVKGGVYGITRGLARRHGAARVFDSVLDEQSILGLALGAGLAGLLPIPEIQYLAYLHNAIDQLRGEAATQQFFSTGQYRNPMVLRLPGLSYQKGFGGHFHNDNAVASLRDIPGLVVGCPSQGADAAGMLRTLVSAAAVDGTVSVFLEPIALYHRRDLAETGDNRWLSVDHGGLVPIGAGRIRRQGDALTMITFGNGVPMSLHVAERLAADDVESTVLDLRWLSPLPVEDILAAAVTTGRVLVVDETRHSGGVGEGVVTALVEHGFHGAIARVAGQDSIIPLGSASDHVLLGPDEIEKAAHELITATRGAARRAR
ncbi:thiamine pyrophosphate-dependent enzyme [Microlunatus sp. Gsoil 973]|uniref:thiamine pyrophosphate-dependent enzyme n=1 Tax=Microlunatus sp. Gsoil 973 TaxID=2672569 RepID=UPI0012B4AD81|nr:thiamine pyrophosphate-dependent enzyme [Microlunatus sp. Gsoil 973]QGN35188.1 MFS transporter [Microlunatus sp. Gsoil 973]